MSKPSLETSYPRKVSFNLWPDLMLIKGDGALSDIPPTFWASVGLTRYDIKLFMTIFLHISDISYIGSIIRTQGRVKDFGKRGGPRNC